MSIDRLHYRVKNFLEVIYGDKESANPFEWDKNVKVETTTEGDQSRIICKFTNGNMSRCVRKQCTIELNINGVPEWEDIQKDICNTLCKMFPNEDPMELLRQEQYKIYPDDIRYNLIGIKTDRMKRYEERKKEGKIE